MNVILGLDSMALKDPDLSPETRSQLEKIGHNARHLLDLVNNVLDINRIETGELVAVQGPFRCLNFAEISIKREQGDIHTAPSKKTPVKRVFKAFHSKCFS